MHLARIRKSSKTFEVAIVPEAAQAFREGKGLLDDALESDRIFTDAKKGIAAKEADVLDTLGVETMQEALEMILKRGEVQTTTTMRDADREKHYREVIGLVARFASDPRSGNPHPIDRIERAVEQAKIKVDYNKSAVDQIGPIIHKLKPILPIKLSTKEVQLTIPAQYAQKAKNRLRAFGTIKKENWRHDGSWDALIEIPGGMEADFYEEVGSLTHGTATVK